MLMCCVVDAIVGFLCCSCRYWCVTMLVLVHCTVSATIHVSKYPFEPFPFLVLVLMHC